MTIHTMIHFSAIKMNEILIHAIAATTWMNLKNVLSESRKTQKITDSDYKKF